MNNQELQELTDRDLMRLSWMAQEQKNSKWIKTIRKEMSRRNKEL
jgi:hypothetical protein